MVIGLRFYSPSQPTVSPRFFAFFRQHPGRAYKKDAGLGYPRPASFLPVPEAPGPECRLKNLENVINYTVKNLENVIICLVRYFENVNRSEESEAENLR